MQENTMKIIRKEGGAPQYTLSKGPVGFQARLSDTKIFQL